MMPMAVATSMNGVVMVATRNANILEKNKMKQELTKERAASIATKVLLNLYAESMPSVAKIVNAEAEIRNGNEEGYTTLCEALAGARGFMQDLMDAMGNGHLWHDAQGDYLPIYDREVIVLCDDGHGGYKVCFGHRPVEYVAGVSYDGKMTYMEAKTYDKGGWNIPDVKWWLDLDLPDAI